MHPIIPPAAAAALLLALAPALAPAQAQTSPAKTPGRLDNIWNNQDHQPTRAEERALQGAAGLNGSAAQQQSEDQEVDDLDSEILDRAEQTGGDGTPGFLNPNPAAPP
ncbi:MAG: hypothetical protein J0I21_20145 [Alphaproteobacteria bacterium]|nr:hypothetical protein [Alphaproteobacteria bacterium]